MTRTCFILDELYPEDRGGIARLMHNILHHAKSLDPALELHVVLAGKKPTSPTLQAAFDGIATLHYFRPDLEVASRFGLPSLTLSAQFAKQAEPGLRELKVLDAVLGVAEAHGPLDHIEIPDHMGLGSIILEAKRAGYNFKNTEITCRIHSSLSAIIDAEPFYHPRSDWLAPRLEMERFALEHADRVVAHLPAIAEFNRAHFSFGKTWLDKVETAFPPVIWPKAAPTRPATGRDFIFTARFQPFKRPLLFIKAAITMLDKGSNFEGLFRLISYGFDRDYIDLLRLSIPARYRDRIRIEAHLSPEARLQAMREGIIVQPSKFESLCALAYEASTMGRPLLLARDCLAFGQEARWQDGKNCLLFAPTPEALAATMERARAWQPETVVETRPDRPYFTTPATPRTTLPPAMPPCRLGVLLGPVESPEALAALAPALKTLSKLRIPVLAFGPVRLKSEDPNISFSQLSDASFKGQQWHALARQLKTDAVVLCTPEAMPSAKFISIGAHIAAPGIVFSAQSRDETTQEMRLYPGKRNTISFVEPRICPPCLILHRENLGLMASQDEQDLLARLIARLARSELDLRLCPAPLVQAHLPALSPPPARLLGYDRPPPWRRGVRLIGVEVKPATRSGLLGTRPLTLSLTPDLTLGASAPLTLETGAAQAFSLSADLALARQIIALTAQHASGDTPILVSLHQARAKPALKAHAAGKNRRQLKPGQRFEMRWGPIWHEKHLTLVISSESTAKVKFDNPVLISLP